MNEAFDPYHKWLGIPPEDQPANYYRLLGIKVFESDADVIESAADRQMSHVKTHKIGKHAALSQTLLNELSAAKVCLLNREKKAAYDENLRRAVQPQPTPQAAPPRAAAPLPRPVAVDKAPMLRVSNSTGPLRRPKSAWRQAAPYLWVAVTVVLFLVGVRYLAGDKETPNVGPTALTVPPASEAVTPPKQPGANVNEKTESGPIASTETPPSRPAWTDGAVLALAFDDATFFENDGGSFVRDLSGEGNHGTLQLAARVPGIAGQALHFASSKHFVEVPNAASLNPTQGLTLAAWIKADSWRGKFTERNILSKSNLDKTQAGYILRGGDGGHVDVVLGVSSWQNVTSKLQLATDQWHHVAATFDQTRVRLFIDGAFQVDKPVASPIKASPYPLRVGAGAFHLERYFLGAIDEVAVWNRDLSPDEVRQLYEFSRGGNSYCLAIGRAKGFRPERTSPRPAEVGSSQRTIAEPVVPDSSPVGGRIGPPKRAPKPDDEALKAADAAIEETYKSELAAARDVSVRKVVAQALFDKAVVSESDPAAMFAMLNRSAALGGQVGDYNLARDALDVLAERFEVDVVPLKEAALSSAARLAKAGDFARVADSWHDLADEALAQDRYEESKRFLQQAVLAARKTADKHLVTLLVDAGKSLDAIQAAYTAAIEAQTALQSNPQDAAAAAMWGRFLCVYKNNWQAGLPIWAAGSADPLVDVARQDLAQPANPTDQLRLADAWWQAAEVEDEAIPRKWLKARASSWYRQARPALAGIDLDRARQRIEESEQVASQFSQGQWVDVLGMVDLTKHKIAGEWARQGTEIAVIKPSVGAHVMVPVAIEGSYDLEVRFALRSGNETDVIIPVGGQQVTIVVGGTKGMDIGGLHLIDGVGADKNATRLKHPRLATGLQYKMKIQVELVDDLATIDVDLNSRRFIRWQGSKSLLSVDAKRQMPNSSTIGLSNAQTTAIYHSVRLRLNSGTAKPLYD